MLASGADASTVLVDFDHIPSANSLVAERVLAGLKWSNTGVIAASYSPFPVGLNEGVVSTPNVAFNIDANVPIAISGRSFGLLDAWFSSWTDDLLEVTARGWNAQGICIQSSQFEVDTLGPILQSFDWDNLVSVTFTASSRFGIPRFSIDDVRLSVAIPEPGEMMLAGVAALFCGRLRASKGRISR